jgi:hypothetical protein
MKKRTSLSFAVAIVAMCPAMAQSVDDNSIIKEAPLERLLAVMRRDLPRPETVHLKDVRGGRLAGIVCGKMRYALGRGDTGDWRRFYADVDGDELIIPDIDTITDDSLPEANRNKAFAELLNYQRLCETTSDMDHRSSTSKPRRKPRAVPVK